MFSQVFIFDFTIFLRTMIGQSFTLNFDFDFNMLWSRNVSEGLIFLFCFSSFAFCYVYVYFCLVFRLFFVVLICTFSQG